MLIDYSHSDYCYDFETTSSSSSLTFPVKPKADAFKALQKTMKECLSSRSKPLFHIFPAVCGGGKSRAVQDFIADWKATGFAVDSSAFIMLPTLEDVDTYISECGLGQGDYACLSPDPKYSRYGLGRGRATEARVLFVTHEQARRRMLEHGSFEAVTAFHYHGRPRALRVCDEGLSPAVPVFIKLSRIEALPDVVRPRNPALADKIDALRLDNAERQAGHVLSVPTDLGREAGAFAFEERRWLSKPYAKVLEGLSYLAGSEAVLRRDNHYGLTVIGASAPLPDDLAPLIILDGSAPLRRSYDLWAGRNSAVSFLSSLTADYSKLTIHWWNRGASKTTLKNKADRDRVVGVIADTIRHKPDEDWLIIHPMTVAASGHEAGYDIEAEIEEALKAGLKVTGNIKFLHWGLHLGRNEYRDIKNVIIIGGLHYGQPGYDALYAASTGTLNKADPQGLKDMATGEFAHHIYQAACRSNLRNIEGGVAGEATVYLIAADRSNRQPLIQRAFTGCSILDWEPVPPKPKAKEQLVMDAMARLFGSERRVIAVRELWQACGGRNADYLRRVWTKPAVIQFMKDSGISRKGNKLIRSSIR